MEIEIGWRLFAVIIFALFIYGAVSANGDSKKNNKPGNPKDNGRPYP